MATERAPLPASITPLIQAIANGDNALRLETVQLLVGPFTRRDLRGAYLAFRLAGELAFEWKDARMCAFFHELAGEALRLAGERG